MKSYSVDTFEMNSRLPYDQILDRLNQRTLRKESLTMKLTDKDFIGRIQDNKFEIFQACFFPYGALCVLQGTISPTSQLQVTTSLHKGFRFLFAAWVASMTILFFAFWLSDPVDFVPLVAFLVGMPIGGFLFRLYLHGAYVLARNSALRKMKEVLEIE
jgi:hypothetical protein